MQSRWFRSVATLVGLLLCLRYLGNFSTVQSALLAAIAFAGYMLYQSAKAADEAEKYFVPYWVDLCPRWFELLRDYKLVPDDEISAEVYKKLSLGIRFEVLQRSSVEENCPGLIFWDEKKTFVTAIDFSIPIPNTSCKEEYGLPEMYFRESARPVREGDPAADIARFKVPKESIAAERALWKELGEEPPKSALKDTICLREQLEIGLRVPTVWWKEMCASGQLKPDSTEAYESKMVDAFPGSTELVAATLPCWLFDGYYRKTVMKDFENKTFRKRLAFRENDLAQRGWEREESDEINSPTCLKHKYFTVWDNAI